jgi:outer membrane receptor protein involved in Fe transport
MSTEQALARLLRGSGLDFVQIDQGTYRLARRKTPAAAARATAASPPTKISSARSDEAIIVTGSKWAQPLWSLPLSAAVTQIPTGQNGALASSEWIAANVEGLTLTNLGEGRNRQFVRGVADSPFNGPTQSTVAIVVDEARVTYNMPDPDLRLIDVSHVELLKGPQGALYGSGVLGGVYHIVTNRPVLGETSGHVAASGSILRSGDVGAAGDVVWNLPLNSESAALRVVGYAERDPGWIDSGGRSNSNDGYVVGGRLAARIAPAANWTVDLDLWTQQLNVSDSQYVSAADTRVRANGIAEPHDNDFVAIAGTVRGRIGSVDFLSSTNWVDHRIDSRFDASASADQYGQSGALIYDEQRSSEIIAQEFRFSRTYESKASWLLGLSYFRAISKLDGMFSRLDAQAPPPAARSSQDVRELALSGEATLPLSATWSLTGGARLFANWVDNELQSDNGHGQNAPRKTGLTPSAALSWQASPKDFLYLRYASALRPGALSEGNENRAARIKSDEIQGFELGYRHGGGTFSLQAATFISFWEDVQSDYLLPNGLVATRNVGDAHIYGGEISLNWQLTPSWLVDGGLTAQHAELTRPEIAVVKSQDLRLPVVPDVTLRAAISRAFDLGGWAGTARADLRYIGHGRLSFDPGLDRQIGGYVLVGLQSQLRRGPWQLNLFIRNLFDSNGDTFAFGNPFSLRVAPQYTPATPRAITMSAAYSW